MILSRRTTPIALVFIATTVVGCRGDAEPTKTRAVTVAPAPTATSDSQYTAAAMIAAFRKSVPEHPATLGGGATTNRDSLVQHYVQALSDNNKAALTAMRISVSEYAWLYYLDMPQSKPPYELDPDVLWMQLSAQSDKGLGRLGDRVRVKPFGYKSYSCELPQKLETVTLHRCTLFGADLDIQMSIIERDGRFKFTSFANQL